MTARYPKLRSSHRCTRLCVAAAACAAALVCAASSARALEPDELLLIYNKNLPESQGLATYYAAMRGVPADRLFGVDVRADKETMAASSFDSRVRGLIRQHLEQAPYGQRVRCLVTFYGLPIRVGQRKITPEQQQLLDTWQRAFLDELDELEHAARDVERLGVGAAPPLSAKRPTEEDYAEILQRYNRARAAAWERLSLAQPSESVQTQREQLMAIVRQIDGPATILRVMKPKHDPKGEGAAQLQAALKEVEAADARVEEILAREPTDPSRAEAERIVQEYHGLIGLLALRQREMARVRIDYTHAALDSELTLLWWDDYPYFRWVENTLAWSYRSAVERGRRRPIHGDGQRVLMVSRIDASTARIARGMIDRAVAAERGGLDGVVYIDAQGYRTTEGKGAFDRNLFELARMLETYTHLDVKLDTRRAVFGPGQCPATMLYCGWYSLRKYVDAFDFLPGAVGYHIGSFEAMSLKSPTEQGWCKGMLDDGIAATLGPVNEPFLPSFPEPKAFFGLLLTGRFTLAECYAYTTRCNSWMMMLLGDPLYRPFARRPPLRLEQVFAPGDIPAAFRSGATTQPGSTPRAR